MKILHVIPSVSPLRGGPSFVIRSITQGLVHRGHDIHVVTTDDAGPHSRSGLIGVSVEEGITYHYFRRDLAPYTISVSLAQWLWRNVSTFDILHIHAVYSFPSDIAAAIALTQSVPYIIRPLGILSHWGMQNRRPLLKKLFYRTCLHTLLFQAAAIHYTSQQELSEAELTTGIATRGVVIPNPVELPTRAHLQGLFRRSLPGLGSRPFLLFLSRIDRKKGLDLLIPALSIVIRSFPNLMLVIAGDGEPDYLSELKSLVASHRLQKHIIWSGFLDGDRKTAAFCEASAFVLSSHSENFGVAPVEAMALGVPIIITDAVGIHGDVTLHSAGIVVKRKVEPLAVAITDLLQNSTLRLHLATNAREMVRTKYSLDAVCAKLEGLYSTVASAPTH